MSNKDALQEKAWKAAATEAENRLQAGRMFRSVEYWLRADRPTPRGEKDWEVVREVENAQDMTPTRLRFFRIQWGDQDWLRPAPPKLAKPVAVGTAASNKGPAQQTFGATGEVTVYYHQNSGPFWQKADPARNIYVLSNPPCNSAAVIWRSGAIPGLSSPQPAGVVYYNSQDRELAGQQIRKLVVQGGFQTQAERGQVAAEVGKEVVTEAFPPLDVGVTAIETDYRSPRSLAVLGLTILGLDPGQRALGDLPEPPKPGKGRSPGQPHFHHSEGGGGGSGTPITPQKKPDAPSGELPPAPSAVGVAKNAATGTIRVVDADAPGLVGGARGGMYTFFHGTNEAGAESLAGGGIRPLGKQEGDFFGTTNPARAAQFGGGRIVVVSVSEEMFLDLWNGGLMRQSAAHRDSFYITPEGQKAINGSLGK